MAQRGSLSGGNAAMTGLPRASGDIILRAWRSSDEADLVAEASNRAVWRNLTHLFSHPYTAKDAKEWVAACLEQDPPRDLVIEVAGEFAGGCGIQPGEGVGVYTGHIGYWLGERFWNQGIATAALAVLVDYIWETFDVERLQAEVFSWNPASARVLERNGFRLEGTRRRAIFKDGELIDEWMYTRFRSESTGP